MATTPTRPLALVTGASSGIGRELALLLAAEGYDLVITAEDDALDDARAEVEAAGAGTVEAPCLDLTRDEDVDTLVRYVRETGRGLDIAALNAGVGAGGAFATDTALADELRIIDLNVRSTVHLAKHVTRDMVRRDHGRILFTSSIAATIPGSYQAVYNASKSFVQSFALALRDELRETAVTVTALMPGPTDTEFFARADMLDTHVGAGEKADAATVAADGYAALMDGDERVVSGDLSTRAQALASHVLPDRVKAALHRRQAEPGSADRDER